MRFEWDPRKASANLRKHGVDFVKVQYLFESEADFLEIYDEEHSLDEERFIAIGEIEQGVVVVVWTEQVEDVVRIISARMATAKEIELYHRYMEGAP